MRKILSILIFAGVTLLLSGCNKKDSRFSELFFNEVGEKLDKAGIKNISPTSRYFDGFEPTIYTQYDIDGVKVSSSKCCPPLNKIGDVLPAACYEFEVNNHPFWGSKSISFPSGTYLSRELYHDTIECVLSLIPAQKAQIKTNKIVEEYYSRQEEWLEKQPIEK